MKKLTCDICGKKGARTRHVSRSYGSAKELLVVEGIPIVSCPNCVTKQSMKST